VYIQGCTIVLVEKFVILYAFVVFLIYIVSRCRIHLYCIICVIQMHRWLSKYFIQQRVLTSYVAYRNA